MDKPEINQAKNSVIPNGPPNGSAEEPGRKQHEDNDQIYFETLVDLIYEAEDAELEALKRYDKDADENIKNISGGYVGKLDSDKSRIVFYVQVPKAGFYELAFCTAAINNESYNTVIVNERILYNTLYTKGADFALSTIKTKLEKGLNSVVVQKGWGYIYIDYLNVKSSEAIDSNVYCVEKGLVNKNATESTKRLFGYMVNQYGKYTLSGQYNNDLGIKSPEVKELYKLTGKYPAIMGFDFVDYSPTRVEHGTKSKQTQYAMQWHEMGGIVTFMWHWNAPKGLINSETAPWWKGFYTQATNFNLDDALNGRDSAGYDLIIRDIDVIAKQLRALAEKDIPVLWRPLHEACGGWFWWGAHGAENYKKLWKLMYNRLTGYHNLNNLIWVYSGEDKEWYPGDGYVDIIAEDAYTIPYDYDSRLNRFEKALNYTGKKTITGLSEIGSIPDPDLMYEENVCWSFFIIWNGEYVVQDKKISDKHNSLEHFVKVFNHDRIITLDELPWYDDYAAK